MEDIDSGLDALVREILERDIHSIAIPPLGSGLGGLNWEDVRPIISKALGDVSNLEVILFEPNSAAVMTKSLAVPAMTPGRVALVILMNRYLGGLMDPFVTLLEVHKLMYFMQEAGELLRLNYSKGAYAPYAANLRPVLRALEGHLTSGYADGDDAPYKQLELVPGALKDAERCLLGTQTAQRLDRVKKLVEGFETPFGLELLATVHWVITRDNAHNLADITAKVYAWNQHKNRFTQRQIEIAYNKLKNEGWC